MKIKANNANSPIWKDVYSHSMLPEALQPLHEMATNRQRPLGIYGR